MQRYVVNRRIKRTFENSALRIFKNYICSVFVVSIPIASVIGMGTRRIREVQLHSCMCRTGDAGGNHIQLRMTYSLYIKSITIQCEMTVDNTIPHIQCLGNIGNIRNLHTIAQLQPYDAQMQAVRVHTEPVRGFFLPSVFLKLAGVQFFMAAPEIVFL